MLGGHKVPLSESSISKLYCSFVPFVLLVTPCLILGYYDLIFVAIAYYLFSTFQYCFTKNIKPGVSQVTWGPFPEGSGRFEEVGESSRKFEEVRESSRKFEKVKRVNIKFEKVRESLGKFEKV